MTNAADRARGHVRSPRIVSLLPAATEIVAALGAADRLVGISHECDYPREAQAAPHVTSARIDATASPQDVDSAVRAATQSAQPLFAIDEERIAALHPDLIITQGLCDVCAVSEGDVRAFAARLATPPAVLSLDARTFDEVLESIAAIGAAIEARDEAEELLAGLRYRMRVVHETLKVAKAPRPRVAVIEWTDPLYVAGHWVPDMIRTAGGRDALASPGDHSVRLDVEKLRSAAPDVLVIAACGYDTDRSAEEGRRLLTQPGWEWARGLPVWAMDGNALTSRPGPRLCVGIEVMARIFNPSLFTPLSPRRARPLLNS